MREVQAFGKIEPWAEGRIVMGVFQDARKPENADSFIYKFKPLNGTRTEVWGTTMLDAAMGDVSEGDYVVILCGGQKGPKKAWSFRLVVLTQDEAVRAEDGKLSIGEIFPDRPSESPAASGGAPPF